MTQETPESNYSKFETALLTEQKKQTELLDKISKNVQFFTWITIISLVLGFLAYYKSTQPPALF